MVTELKVKKNNQTSYKQGNCLHFVSSHIFFSSRGLKESHVSVVDATESLSELKEPKAPDGTDGSPVAHPHSISRTYIAWYGS